MLEPMLEIGFGNYIFPSRVVAILNPEIEFTKRLVKEHKQSEKFIDVTSNRKLRAVIVLDTGIIILSGIDSDTIKKRYLGHIEGVQGGLREEGID